MLVACHRQGYRPGKLSRQGERNTQEADSTYRLLTGESQGDFLSAEELGKQKKNDLAEWALGDKQKKWDKRKQQWDRQRKRLNYGGVPLNKLGDKDPFYSGDGISLISKPDSLNGSAKTLEDLADGDRSKWLELAKRDSLLEKGLNRIAPERRYDSLASLVKNGEDLDHWRSESGIMKIQKLAEDSLIKLSEKRQKLDSLLSANRTDSLWNKPESIWKDSLDQLGKRRHNISDSLGQVLNTSSEDSLRSTRERWLRWRRTYQDSLLSLKKKEKSLNELYRGEREPDKKDLETLVPDSIRIKWVSKADSLKNYANYIEKAKRLEDEPKKFEEREKKRLREGLQKKKDKARDKFKTKEKKYTDGFSSVALKDKKKWWPKNLFFDGLVGVGYRDYLSLDISPALGWQFSRRTAGGIGAHFRYSGDSLASVKMSTALRTFLRHELPGERFFTQAELQSSAPSMVLKWGDKADKGNKKWEHRAYIGAGAVFGISRQSKSAILATLMYRVAQWNRRDPGESPWQLRFGFKL
ncbi:hypothetical protein [Fulvitalea axinellae]|uniref:hypothetical protein n=1 Tax=Fulvitalea axinellae TaxID=1182444 RepID=UPI0030CA1F2D